MTAHTLHRLALVPAALVGTIAVVLLGGHARAADRVGVDAASITTETVGARTEPPAGGGHHPPPRPPREAVEACEGLEAGDLCGFTSPHGSLEGTCKPPPRGHDGPLACVPAGHRPPPPKGEGKGEGEGGRE